MAETPTNRTVRFLEKHSIQAGNVERFVRQAGPHGKRYDLFGFIDVIACYPEQIAGLQITSTSNRQSRIKKIMHDRSDEAYRFCQSGGLIEVWGWSKRKVGNRRLWTPKVAQIVQGHGRDLVLIDDINPDLFPRERPRLRPICKNLQK